MTIERACIDVVRKPWGSPDLRPWSDIHQDGAKIGELWFRRSDTTAPGTALLFKLLFTTEPLSIQVHPGDEFAQSLGLANGKSEAWYVLSATPNAEVALGLKREQTPAQLRAAIEDRSIADLVRWHIVLKDDVVFVPAGTIHAIGAGLVIAEIQQRSDATFRLFDHGRQRELHVENGVGAAIAGPAGHHPGPRPLSDVRTLLVASPHFVLERVDLPPDSEWKLDAERETWGLVLGGSARVGGMSLVVGEVVFLEAERTAVTVGAGGCNLLLAYLGPELSANLLQKLETTKLPSAAPHLAEQPA